MTFRLDWDSLTFSLCRGWAPGEPWVPGGVLQSRAQLTACCGCRVDSDDLWGEYSCVFLPEPTGRADIQLDGESCSQGCRAPPTCRGKRLA